ncbi:MAG: riboflavin biosynthesis protein RibF, partial [Steroidobacteraceae bacterium]|nr:riboflavin biosynthesis protein RibF [Steroidobacteraceae bacterium]
MELVRGLGNLRPAQRGAVATIGAFDGVHLGHQALIRRTRQLAALHNRTTMLITFEPLPREYLQRDAAPARLTNFRERWRLLSAAGVDALLVLRFNAALQQMHGDEFVALLARELQLRAIVVGYDFRFGRGGEMTAGVLEELGRQHGFGVEIVPPVLVGNERCSSSRIRAALSAADFAAAAQLLGRPYSMRGRVVRGQQLGRSLGFPTANVRLKRRHCPLRGIFAARARG